MKPVLYIVTIEVAPGSEDAWHAWHEKVHVPEVIRQPGFLACRKWKDTINAEDGWARYVCHYELASAEALQRYTASDAAKQLKAESEKRFGYVTRHHRQIYEEVSRYEIDTEPEGSDE
ncbi:DUF4286 family protein [Hyalangium versicolor]|uniref:DUF4286 family protein n=1 Tax=Hyalangium versicolor TaxID=2861190 RepID=UPI001CCE8BD3|nr:DUF4286 family protein [Hyalangium versicolor]